MASKKVHWHESQEKPEHEPEPLLRREDEEETSEKMHFNVSALMSCVMYVTCSTLMVLTNKWLASTLDVNAHISLLLMQNFVATMMVASCKAVGIVSYPAFDVKVALQWRPVDVCFVLMLSTSFVAMRFLSVPMITVFKQLANLLTVCGEFYFFSKPVTSGVLLSFLVMILGAVLAAANDLDFSAAGYLWQAANCVATSSYVLYLKHATHTIDVSKFGLVFYNNLLSLPLLAAIALAHGEFPVLVDAYARGAIDSQFFAVNAFAGTLGLFLNLASVWCVAATSATTYAVVGALNKVPSSVLGYLLFSTIITRKMAVYIGVSLAGGFIYTYEKLQQSRRTL